MPLELIVTLAAVFLSIALVSGSVASLVLHAWLRSEALAA